MFAEKAATLTVMPVGLTWTILAGRLIHVTWLGKLRENKRVLFSVIALWVLGSPHLADWLVESMENSVPNTYRANIDPPLDVIVVLGGGTNMGPDRAQVAGAGDRVIYAAELFRAGKTKILVTTGQVVSGLSRSETSPAQQTIEIWQKLGIPREAMETFPGRNTFEEISQIKQRVDQLAGRRVGILTSALHLPRAMRLAKAAGLSAIPIAADVRSADNRFIPWEFMPQASNLDRLHFCQIELMARLVAR